MDTEKIVAPSMSEGSDPLGVVTHKLDSAAESANRLVDTIADAAHPVVDQLATGAHQAVNSAADAMANASSTVMTKGAQLRDTQIRLTESCRVTIREQPLVAVGLAFAAGFVLSLMVRPD